MSQDLHAAITARLDDLKRLADIAGKDSGSKRWVPRMMGGAPPDVAEHIATWDPATVLRGLAEDRDILARHAPEVREAALGPYEFCSGCEGANCNVVGGYPCPDVASLARRHGIPS